MRFLARLIAVALLSSLLYSCDHSSDDANPKGTRSVDPSEFSGKPGDCKEFIANLPANYFHDWMTVPENPFDPSSPQINVFYYGPNQ